MVFSSVLFLFVYLPSVLLIYYAVPPKFRNLVLFIVSLVFYGWGEPVYISIMIFSTILDYTCSFMIEKSAGNKKHAKAFLIVSLAGNLFMLCVFKYLDFIILNLSYIPALSGLKPLGIPLPIGISFYTFQTMSYTIDVYRGINQRQKSFVTLGAYVTLFPQLIAGPIVKYKDVARELECRTYTAAQFSEGIGIFTVGLCKKVLIANSVGSLFDTYHAMELAKVSTLGAWLAVISYTFQIYFDFSGYSDMAIGLGKMLGFNFLRNFNYPYIACSITDFWRRWHISLSSWFKEYLYIPLGGNRRGPWRTIFNLLVVWTLTGIWHGASWNYLLWGLYFFVLLVIEKQWLLKYLDKVPHVVGHVYALLLIVISWVLFSNEDLSRCLAMLAKMFTAGINTSLVFAYDWFYLANYGVIFVLAALSSIPFWHNLFFKLSPKLQGTLKIILVILGLTVCTASLVDSTYNPFLYFRF
ncbi:MAG: MBOAT family O-acyltransferase [Peptococcaceae bacterium]